MNSCLTISQLTKSFKLKLIIPTSTVRTRIRITTSQTNETETTEQLPQHNDHWAAEQNISVDLPHASFSAVSCCEKSATQLDKSGPCLLTDTGLWDPVLSPALDVMHAKTPLLRGKGQ